MIAAPAIHVCSVREPEAQKYETVWADIAAYRTNSPGATLVPAFRTICEPEAGCTVLDVGCGTGRAGVALAAAGFAVRLVDGTAAGLDAAAAVLPFTQACLWDAWGVNLGDWAFCCDVLEHLPPEFTMLAIARLLKAAPRAFLHIACEPDVFGAQIGQPLHLTVQPFAWWRDRLAEVGTLVEARDLLGSGLFVVTRR